MKNSIKKAPVINLPLQNDHKILYLPESYLTEDVNLNTISTDKYEIFLVTWFDTAYFLAFSPFRFKSSTNSSDELNFRIVKNRTHQVWSPKMIEISLSCIIIIFKAKKCFGQIICGIGHFLALQVYLTEWRKRFNSLGRAPTNPVAYLNFFLKTTSVFHHIIMVSILWGNARKFLSIVQYLSAKRAPFVSTVVTSKVHFNYLPIQSPKTVICLLFIRFQSSYWFYWHVLCMLQFPLWLVM